MVQHVENIHHALVEDDLTTPVMVKSFNIASNRIDEVQFYMMNI